MRRHEDGVVVVLAVGLIGLLVAIGVLGAAAVSVVAVHRQLQAAADLAALAGATAAGAGGVPCAAAATIAVRNRSEVSSCESDAGTVLVVVQRRLSAVFGDRVLRARARAGPAAATD